VIERIRELEEHGRKPTASRWEEVILFEAPETKSTVKTRNSVLVKDPNS
jgi:hypothetical protein